MGVTLFHHPDAGPHAWSADRLLEGLRHSGIRASYCCVDEAGWEDALGQTRDLAIIAGGDGTVAKLIRAIQGDAVPIAILPTGSGNNIARSLGVFASLEEVIRGLADPTQTVFRVGRACGSWGERQFVEAIGLGALARSVAELQDAKLDGLDKLQNGRAALRSQIVTAQPVRATVHVDGQRFDDAALLLEVMNIPMIGPNIRLCADHDLADEMLSLVYLPVENRQAMLTWLDAPQANGPAPVRNLRCRRVRFEAQEEPLRFDDKTAEWDGSDVVLEREKTLRTVLGPRRHR
jgi:diacylglycerol kinase family enzyme